MHKSVLFGAKANVSLGMVPESLASTLCAGQLYGQNWKHILKIRVFFPLAVNYFVSFGVERTQ